MPRIIPSGIRALALAALSVGCAASDDGVVGRVERRDIATSLSAQCDAHVASTRIAPVAQGALLPISLDSIPLPGEVARVRDVIGSATDTVFTVLDSRNERFVRIDQFGKVITTFSQRGRGPGDLSFPPPTTPAGSRLAVVGRGAIMLAADRRSLKAFDALGRPRWDRAVATWPEGMNAGFHLAALDDSIALFSVSGKFLLGDSSRAVRTRITVYEVGGHDRPAVARFTLDNDWVLLPEIGRGFPAHRPYRDEWRQVWDARDGTIAILSYRSFRVCFFDSQGAITAAHEMSLAASPVDEAERRRVLTESFGTVHDKPLPVIGRTARELYSELWPKEMPRYTDILLDGHRRAWVFRRVSATRVAVDVVDHEVGYLGTFEPPLGRLPLRIGGSDAIVADNEEMLLLRYRVGFDSVPRTR